MITILKFYKYTIILLMVTSFICMPVSSIEERIKVVDNYKKIILNTNEKDNNNKKVNESNTKENFITQETQKTQEIQNTEEVQNIQNINTEEETQIEVSQNQEDSNISNNTAENYIYEQNINTSFIPQYLLYCANQVNLNLIIDNSIGYAGLFSINKGSCSIRINIYNSKQYINNIVAHEYGHFLDFLTNESSALPEFIQIYEIEKNNFKVDYSYEYSISDKSEYYAQAFSEYIFNPQRLQMYSPATYDYIQRDLNSLSEENIKWAKFYFDL